MHMWQLAQCLVCRVRVTWTVSWWCLRAGCVLRVKISTPNTLIFIYTTKLVCSILGSPRVSPREYMHNAYCSGPLLH